jgi:citrate synthase
MLLVAVAYPASVCASSNVPKFVEQVKAKKVKLMGFGHRVYKNYDPRARIIKKLADEVFAILGREDLIEVAVALEKVALLDTYFIGAAASTLRGLRCRQLGD